MGRKRLQPIPPGEVLLGEFMKPSHLSASCLARCVQVPRSRIREIIQGKRPITPEMALRLGKYFGIAPEIWLDLQIDFEQRIRYHTR